jgi:hypothetical protein
MHQVGSNPMIPVFEQAKTVHALDSVATEIGKFILRPAYWKFFTHACPVLAAIQLLSHLMPICSSQQH